MGGGKPFLPSLTFDTTAERVSRDVCRWLFTPRETDYVQLKELHVCVTEREGEEESAREDE